MRCSAATCRRGPTPRRPAITTAIGNTAKATLSDYMGSDTYIFTPRAINVARFSYNRIDAHPAVTSGLKNEDYGINVPNTNALAQGLASIAITGFFNLGDAQQPFVKRVNEVFQFTDDFTWSRGSHGLKFGADLRKEHMVIAFINRPNGDMTFNGQAASGNAAADFLLGFPSQFRRTTTNQAQDGIGWLYSGYAQDEWRASPHLTVNAGVRYELSLPFVDANDALNAFHPGVQSVRFPAAPAGLVYPGDPGVPRGTYATDKNNFAPRFGAVWDPQGDGRTTIRGAWGIFYDALAGQGDFFQNGVLAPPFTPLVEVNSPPASITIANPLNAITGGATLFPPGLTIIGWGEDFQTPYAYHFNLTVQRQVGKIDRRRGGLRRLARPRTCRSSSRSTRVSSRRGRPRRARGSSRRSRWCARPSRSPSPGTIRCRRARGCGRPTASTSSRPTPTVMRRITCRA